MITEKLYYKDSYITEAKCQIEDIIEKDGEYHIVLKSTPFFPEGGGQSSDKGFIDDIEVKYVYEDNDIVYHVLDRKPQNKLVDCKVDYDRRFEHIQQHSGEHLLSGTIYKLYNGVNVGFRLGEEYLTIDVDIATMTEDMIRKVENEANMYIYKNEAVKTYFLPKDEAAKLPLRKAITVEGNIRIVQMGESGDFCACCGTHVKFTGEIGIIKIIKYEKYKGATRLYVKCGLRAFNDYGIKHDIITEVARGFSTDASEILGKIKAQKEEIIDLKTKVSNLYDKIATQEAKKLEIDAKLIVATYENEGMELLEKLYERLKDKEYVLVLSSLKDKKLILAQNGSFDFECGKVFKESLTDFNGRGGGSAKKAQASFEDEDTLKRYIDYLVERLKIFEKGAV